MTTLTTDRRTAIARQDLSLGGTHQILTGIDFVRVADKTTQVVLHVFFIVDPHVVHVLSSGGALMGVPGAAFALDKVTVAGADPAYLSQPVTITSAKWKTDASSNRTVLEVVVSAPGDFSTYRLTVTHPAMDWYFAAFDFSFKDACPSDFDCAEATRCPPAGDVDVAVDYLARDFASFNDALLAYCARAYPQWQEAITADMGVMLIELMSALGDEFSYIQDRMSRESALGTATQRRSLMHMAKLIDYRPDPGGVAYAWLSVAMKPGTTVNIARRVRTVPCRFIVFAPVEGAEPVPFEVVVPDTPDETAGDDWFYVHEAWNAIAPYIADPGVPCLEIGATSVLLAPRAGGGSPLGVALTPAPTRPNPQDLWIGRDVLLVCDPDDPSAPAGTARVTVTKVEIFTDLLTGDVVTRLHWDVSQALEQEMRLSDLRVHGNVVRARAGQTVEADFRVGDWPAGTPEAALPPAIVRQGALYQDFVTGEPPARATNVRFGLEPTVLGGLAFDDQGLPDIRLSQYDALGGTRIDDWDYIDTLLEADNREPWFTLEAGLWAEAVRYERMGEVFVHADYVSGDGFTLAFGDDVIGQRPEDGTVFHVRYRLNPGVAGNVPARTITWLGRPNTASELVAKFPEVKGVTNPLPAAGGRDPESAARIRNRAPQLYRARPMRAVVESDFQTILGRMPQFQAIGAGQRWTGSWLTRFVTADPLDREGLSGDQKAQLRLGADAIRMAARDVAISDPVYRAFDLSVTICVAPAAYFGQVSAGVLAALLALFDPDHFTFGSALVRSQIEAAVQAVPGVVGIHAIAVRSQTTGTWQAFTQDRIEVGVNEIIRIHNDPRYPDRGSIKIVDHQAEAV